MDRLSIMITMTNYINYNTIGPLFSWSKQIIFNNSIDDLLFITIHLCGWDLWRGRGYIQIIILCLVNQKKNSLFGSILLLAKIFKSFTNGKRKGFDFKGGLIAKFERKIFFFCPGNNWKTIIQWDILLSFLRIQLFRWWERKKSCKI